MSTEILNVHYGLILPAKNTICDYKFILFFTYNSKNALLRIYQFQFLQRVPLIIITNKHIFFHFVLYRNSPNDTTVFMVQTLKTHEKPIPLYLVIIIKNVY